MTNGWVKTCIKCGVERLLSDFRHRNKRRSDARENVCRDCRNVRSRELDNILRGGTGTPAGMLFWPESRFESLARYLEEGLSYREIAQALGITKCAVIGKVWRLGLCNDGSSTMTQRLDALHARMDAVLAESAAIPRRMPLPRDESNAAVRIVQ